MRRVDERRSPPAARAPLVAVALSIAAFTACGGDATSGPLYRITGSVVACESLEVARTRADLLDSGDAAEAQRFAADRCFGVEATASMFVTDAQAGGFLRGKNRWVHVTSANDEPLEHHASAELKRTLGLEPGREGWVRLGELAEVQ